MVSGPEEFFGSAFNETAFYYPGSKSPTSTVRDLRDRIEHLDTFEKLDPGQCAKAYSQQYVSQWGDVLVVGNSITIEGSRSVSHNSDLDRTALPSGSTSCHTYAIVQTIAGCSISSVDTQLAFWDSATAKWNRTNETTAQPSKKTLNLPIIAATNVWNADESARISYDNETLHLIPSFYVQPSLSYQSSPMSFPSYIWQCPDGNSANCSDVVSQLNLNNIPWSPFGGHVLYCYAERKTETCTLDVNIHLAYVVIVLNLVKV